MHAVQVRDRSAKRCAGFSVWELVIVAAIVAGAAFMIVPRLKLFQARARQAEAKNNLVVISTLEAAYLNANKVYSSSLDELGFKTVGNARYRYKIVSAGETLFTALAQASSTDAVLPGCGSHDSWTIDQTRRIRPSVDCSAR